MKYAYGQILHKNLIQLTMVVMWYLPIFYFFGNLGDYMNRQRVYDKEYATQFKAEMMYLKECGIHYSWVIQNESGVSIWKYKKTVELFTALAKFYQNVYYK